MASITGKIEIDVRIEGRDEETLRRCLDSLGAELAETAERVADRRAAISAISANVDVFPGTVRR